MSDPAPRPRSRAGATLSAALAAGRVELQRCMSCGVTRYPPAEICRRCLGDEFELSSGDLRGTVIASAAVHRSYAADFAAGAPWPVASITMNSGPVVFAHVAELLDPGTAVFLVPLTDRLGDGVLGAVREPGEHELLQARFGTTT